MILAESRGLPADQYLNDFTPVPNDTSAGQDMGTDKYQIEENEQCAASSDSHFSDQQPASSDSHFSDQQPASSDAQSSDQQPASSDTQSFDQQPASSDAQSSDQQPASSDAQSSDQQPASSNTQYFDQQPANSEGGSESTSDLSGSGTGSRIGHKQHAVSSCTVLEHIQAAEVEKEDFC